MKKTIIFLIPIMLVFLFGCKVVGVKGNGNVTHETRELKEFSELEISGAYNVDVFVGEEPSLEISGEDNLLPYIVTEVVGNELKIYNDRNINPRKRIVIKIQTPNLESISSSGASNIYAESIYNKDFKMSLSGAGNIELNGDVDEFAAYLSGAGSLEAKDLKSKYASINISGASNASVYASDKLKASVSGVGKVDFYGNPKDVKTDISGIGSVKRKGD